MLFCLFLIDRILTERAANSVHLFADKLQIFVKYLIYFECVRIERFLIVSVIVYAIFSNRFEYQIYQSNIALFTFV